MSSIQDIYNKFYKKEEFNKNYIEKLYFTNDKKIIFPIDKMLTYINEYNKECPENQFKDLDEERIESIKYRWEIQNIKFSTYLINSLKDYLKQFNLTYEQYIFNYMYTIQEWTKIYRLTTLEFLNELLIWVLDEILYYNFFITSAQAHLYELSMFMIAEEYKNKSIVRQEDRIVFIKVFSFIFYIENINILDRKKWINLYGIKFYKRFISEIYKYIDEFKEETIDDYLDDKTNGLYKTFINHYIYSGLITNGEFEKIILKFAEKGFISNGGLRLLKAIKSSHVDKYKSYILIKDLKKE